MRNELEQVKDKVDSMLKDHPSGDIREILEMIKILADAIKSEASARMWQGASGHGY